MGVNCHRKEIMKQKTIPWISLAACAALTVIIGVLISQGGQQQSETVPEPITFTFYNADGIEDPWSDPVALRITERTGVTLKTDYPSGSTDRVALMVATGEYPDLIYAKGDAGLLIQQGALVDLSPLIDEYAPHIRELYGEQYEQLRSADGAIWQLCSGKVEDMPMTTAGSVQLQWAVLSANDYQIPRTLEEYTGMIREYLAAYPTIQGRKTIGLSLVCTDWHWYTTLSNPSGYIMNGSPDNGQWIVKDGVVCYKHAAEGQKEYYRWLNEMYHEGILDPEFATQTHEDYIEKITQGRVLGLLDSGWGYAEAERALRQAGMEERTYAGLPVTADESVLCPMLMPRRMNIGWGIGITTSCDDPVRAIQFLDWMCTEEAQILVNWGLEGINYTVVDGKRVRTEADLTDSLTATDYAERTGVGFHVYPFPGRGSLAKDTTGNYISHDNREEIQAQYTEQERTAASAWGVELLTDIFPKGDAFEMESFPPLWAVTLSPEMTTLLEKLDAVAQPGLIDCIVCSPEEFDQRWEQFQQDLRDTGLEEANRMMTEIVRQYQTGDV